jgi:hypothetical protein
MSVFLLHGTLGSTWPLALEVEGLNERRELIVGGCPLTLLRRSKSRSTEDSLLHFAGHAFAADALLFGEEAVRRYGRAFDNWDGAFTLVQVEADVLKIITDYNGSDPIFFYAGPSEFAVSNSFLALAEALQVRQVPMSAYEPSLVSFQIPLSLGSQLISSNTPISEIKLLEPFRRIEVSFSAGRFSFKALTVEEPFVAAAKTWENYEERVFEAAQVELNRLASLLSSPMRVSMGLSGGGDSRIILGLALLTGLVDRIKIRSGTHEAQSVDLAIAQGLAERFGFTLNATAPPAHGEPLSAEQGYRLFKLANTCVYSHGVLPLSRDMTDSLAVDLHGGYGGVLRTGISELGSGDLR